MNWITLYITGKADFREEVRRKLDSATIDYMPGYMAGNTGKNFYDLYWLNEKTDLRSFKEALGSKLIFKYRLRFYKNLEDFIEEENSFRRTSELTRDDLALIEAMRNL
jgi:hypothetical protein